MTKTQINILSKVKLIVEEKLNEETTGHDFYHAERVYNTCLFILKNEKFVDSKPDEFVVLLAALLHDISDWKFNGGDLEGSGHESTKILSELKIDTVTINKVQNTINQVSFKGALVNTTPLSIEGKVVQDADRLEALGPIGIARCFAYGGKLNRMIYDPKIKPTLHKTFESYKSSSSPSLNHFYEKLLLLEKLMNTTTGKRLAKKGTDYLKSFLKDFLSQWNSHYYS